MYIKVTMRSIRPESPSALMGFSLSILIELSFHFGLRRGPPVPWSVIRLGWITHFSIADVPVFRCAICIKNYIRTVLMDLIPRIEVILITHRNFLSVFVLGRSLKRFSDGKMLTKFKSLKSFKLSYVHIPSLKKLFSHTYKPSFKKKVEYW